MTDTRNDTASVVDRIHPVAAGGAVIAAHFLGRMAVFVLGEEALVLAPPRGEPKSVTVHGGAILATAVGESVVVSGGDDGKVVETDVSGTSRTAWPFTAAPFWRAQQMANASSRAATTAK